MQERVCEQLRDELKWDHRRSRRFGIAAVLKLKLVSARCCPAASVCLARLLMNGVCSAKDRGVCLACLHWHWPHCRKSPLAAFVSGCWRSNLQRSGIGDHSVWFKGAGIDNRKNLRQDCGRVSPERSQV
eukprot:4670072-Amphidinium_carterae.1